MAISVLIILGIIIFYSKPKESVNANNAYVDYELKETEKEESSEIEAFTETTTDYKEEATEKYEYLDKLEIDNKNLLKWKWVIEPERYEDLYFIDKDKIAVKNKAEKWGIIDIDENIILPLEYSYVGYFNDNIALVKNENGCFYVDQNGEKINQECYNNGGNFNEGYCAVEIGDKWGFIDEKGKIAVEAKFEEAKSFSEGYAPIKIGDKWGFVNKNGDIVVNSSFEEVNGFKNGLAIVTDGNKWGIIDKKGNNIVNFIYDEIRDFSEGYGAVRIGEKWGLINSEGKICISPKYAQMGSFSEGKLAVKKDKDSDLWAYVDNNDRIVIDYMSYTAVNALHSFAGEFKGSKAFASRDYYTIIDDKGKNIFNSYFFISDCYYNEEYNAISGYVFADSSMTVRKYGYADINGNARLEPVFDYAYALKGKYAVVEKIINNEYKKGVIEVKK